MTSFLTRANSSVTATLGYSGEASKLLEYARRQIGYGVSWYQTNKSLPRERASKKVIADMVPHGIRDLAFTLNALQLGNSSKRISPSKKPFKAPARACYSNALRYSRKFGSDLVVGGWFDPGYYKEIDSYTPGPYFWRPLQSETGFLRPIFVSHGFNLEKNGSIVDPTLDHKGSEIFVYQPVPESVVASVKPRPGDDADLLGFSEIEGYLHAYKNSLKNHWKPILNYLVSE